MERRLKIYFIHSNNFDYKSILYKPLLTSDICVVHELMLPDSNAYREKYAKDLINSADIIIAIVSNPSFGLSLELKWLSKANKRVKYISLNNEIPKAYKKYVRELDLISDERPLIKIIEDFIYENANISEKELKDPTIVLGDL